MSLYCYGGNVNDLQNEKELIELAKQSPEAFGKIYDHNYSIILNYVLRRTGNSEIARDITGETFVKAFENIKNFKWQGVSFTAWLYRIAGNEIVNYFRKKTYTAVSLEFLQETQGFETESKTDLESELIEAEQELKRHEEFLFYRQKISELPIKYQEAIALKYFEGKNNKQISEILGKPENTIKSLLHRGLEKLRIHITKENF